MIELFAVAFLGGLITGVSPCIVPVLPVVVGGSTGTSKTRPILIIIGLVVSFSLAELLGVTVLSALHLPQNLLFWLGIALLLILAVGLMIPFIGDLLERPFNRLGSSRYAKSGGGFVLGLSLGLVFVPCAGPVLAAISVAAANHRISASSLFVTFFYSLGAALPLLLFAILAQRASIGWQRLRNHLSAVRRIGGAVLAVTTIAIAFGVFNPLQRAVPGYTSSLENHVESSGAIAKRLQSLSGEHANQFTKNGDKSKTVKVVSLPVLGVAPAFTGIVSWLNTPGHKPLTLSQLRGKVVLIDFWTYSCINCQRALPHVEAWYKSYADKGLVVVGVHTPEFAFEHVVSNVRSAAANLGVKYQIAVDSNYGTWNAYGNQYWPAEYLIDPNGKVRAYDFGEGDYATMESHIRTLLLANGSTDLLPATEVPNKTPTAQLTPESYIGYAQGQNEVGTAFVDDKFVNYQSPAVIPANSFALSGMWNDHMEEATSGVDAGLDLQFTANDVYLVIGGTGTVDVSFNGKSIRTISVKGIPKLYTLFSGSSLQTGELQLKFSAGVQAYDFTFG